MAIPVAMIGLGLVFILMAAAALLLIKGKMSSIASLLLLAATILGPGLALGGLPDPVPPLQQIPCGIVRGTVNPVPAAGLAVLLLASLLAGRLFCGYACPLGAVQELLARPVKKKMKVNMKAARIVRLSVLAALIAAGAFAVFYPAIDPMAVFSLRPNWYQLALFAGIAVAAVFVYRPWCTLLCPFGALAELAARFSPFRLRADARCNDCGACDRICPAGQSVRKGSLTDCYYCGRCIRACPKKAIYAAHGARTTGDARPPIEQPLNRQV
ncbi:MAG: quinol dehydrogenase membrane component [Methanocella sp. PtaU1.Bin125]|nr:MAG: quinol dehydrogenase membrane component [Methanocella sp. PtaU1.Bin125]